MAPLTHFDALSLFIHPLTPHSWPLVGRKSTLSLLWKMAAHSPLDVEPTSNIEEEARRAARKRAIERLAEELQNPDQLVKVLPPFCALFGACFSTFSLHRSLEYSVQWTDLALVFCDCLG